MGAIPVSFTGVMWYPDLSVGGGPMPGGPPLGIWGGKPPPYVDIGPPGPQPPWPSRPPVDPGYGYPERPVDPGYGYPIRPVDPGYGVPVGGPPHPSQPIYWPGGPPGSAPPGYWGGGMGPGVKPQPPGSPGQPPLGIWGGPFDPPRPTHPIYFPPPGSPPPLGIWGPPDMPPGFWGGGMGPGVKPQPHPEHPIVLPPNLPPEIPPPEGGGPALPIDWKVAWTPQTGWVVVGIPSGAHPAPSAAPTPPPA